MNKYDIHFFKTVGTISLLFIVTAIAGYFYINADYGLPENHQTVGWLDGNITYTKYQNGSISYTYSISYEDFFRLIEKLEQEEIR